MKQLGSAILLLAIGFNCYATCTNIQVRTFALPTIFSFTLDAESALQRQLNRLTECDAAERKVIAAKFQLGFFWSQFGIENQQALAYLSDAKSYYQKSIKWNHVRYAKVLLALSHSYFLNGQFQSSMAHVHELFALAKQYPQLSDFAQQNAGSMALLLAIALDDREVPFVDRYNPVADLRRFNIAYQEESAFDFSSNNQMSSALSARAELRRIIRWLQFQYFTGKQRIEDDALKDIDYAVSSQAASVYSDELFLSYALSRFAFVHDNRCASSSAKFILKKYQQDHIESTLNRIATLAVVTECATQGTEQAKHLHAYLTMLNKFYQNMPPDFSAAVFFPLRQSSAQLFNIIDWPALPRGWQHLAALIQLSSIGSAAKSPAKAQESGLANDKARQLFVERDRLSNRFFALSQSTDDNVAAQRAAVNSQLQQLTATIEQKYPALLRSTVSRAVAANTIQLSLAPKSQLVMWHTSKNRVCGVSITPTESRVQCHQNAVTEFERNVLAFRQALIENQPDLLQAASLVSTALMTSELLQPDRENLLAFSNDVLSGVPINALITRHNNQATWLAAQFNVTRVLNLSSIIDTQKSYRKMNKRLAIANPRYNNSAYAQHGSVDVDSFFRSGSNSLETLVPLIETEEEAKEFIKNALQGELLLSTDATEKRVISSLLKSWDVVLFSTHTLFPDTENALNYPALALTPTSTERDDDGLLEAPEIAKLSVKGTWIILAACDTANTVGKKNNLGSLLEAFTLAGAGNVLASHWKINSKETQRFMVLLSENLTDSIEPTFAVWQTRKAMIQNTPPRVWSALDLYL